ncbi:hypothetical protein AB0M02_22665 [Actinoplanes sp. NPDC051861]|uniref:hypothetical protein n=1 Tax=Actinoplanes sp. NPDC051861 TaxID=3155170 RepID=UPI003444CF9F
MTNLTRNRWFLIGAPVLVAAVVVCLLAGLPPLLPVVLAALAYAAVTPVAGMIYVLVVLMAPLGLWLIRVDAFMAWVFDGRDYALSLSASVIAVVLMAGALIRRPPTKRQLMIAAPVLLVFGVYGVIGLLHHGFGQTVAGARITALPAILMIIVVGLTARELNLLLTVTAWLMVANGVAAVVEYIIGPEKLVSYGFEEGRAVRLIGDTFRAPGLTEVNAELGLLAGSFLLGYLALWLVKDLRPSKVVWHAAAGAAVIALALSTSRSAALLVASGLGAAVVLNRGGGPAARKRARLIGGAMVVVLVGGFAAIGATGASSLLERFQIWGRLIESGGPWYGNGVGGAGAATYSRVASSPQVFVDNYFVSMILQYGYLVAAAVAVLIIWGLFRLWRGSEGNDHYVVYIAVLAGATCGSLMIELWEYTSAMACLALFVAYAMRSVPATPPSPATESEPAAPAVDPAQTVRLNLDPAATVRLHLPPPVDPAETARLNFPQRPPQPPQPPPHSRQPPPPSRQPPPPPPPSRQPYPPPPSRQPYPPPPARPPQQPPPGGWQPQPPTSPVPRVPHPRHNGEHPPINPGQTQWQQPSERRQ